MGTFKMWVKRPMSNENDEEIIRLRDEFMHKKSEPSAKCMRKPQEETLDTNKVCKATTKCDSKCSASDAEIGTSVLFSVVERDTVDFGGPMQLTPMPNGFPSLPPKASIVVQKKKKKSIFLQQIEDMEPKNNISSVSSSHCDVDMTTMENLMHSFIIDGSGLGESGNVEAKKLHEENLQKISSMSKDEIIQFQAELCSSLGQDKINFLRSKRKALQGDRSSGGSVSFHDSMLPMPTISPQAKLHNTDKMSSYILSTKHPNLSGDPLERTLKEEGSHDHDAIIIENMPSECILEDHKDLDTQEASCSVTKPASPKDLPVEELPINPTEAGQWVNMGKIEKDKLAWMTLLPKPKAVDAKTKYVARFDFEGSLLSHDCDIPTQFGLHHHSDEPEVAGYNIEELFLIARSSFQSQRVSALETLAHILEKYWDGQFDDCFEAPLITTLLQAGLAPLLRWALDDSTVPSIAAAVLAIHHLLVCKSDEICLDRVFCWLHGHISPLLAAQNSEPCPNLEVLTDASIIKMDVITGFLRMDILPRFRYILRVVCPPSSVCQLIIEICIRIARHSSISAKQVAEFPGLMEAVFQKFLPVNWSCNLKNYGKHNTSGFFCPMPSAVKLVRVIASTDKDLALYLIKNYTVVDSLMCYLTIDPRDTKLRPAEVHKLMVESLKLWHTLLMYDLCTNIYKELQPLLLMQFLFCESLSISTDVEKNIQNYEYAAHFLKALEAVVLNIADDHELQSGGNLSILTFEDVLPLLDICGTCLKRWLSEVSSRCTNYSGRVLLASCLNFITAFCNKAVLKIRPSLSDMLQEIVKCYLQPYLISENFQSLLSTLNSCSLLLYDGFSGCKRQSDVLPCLGSVLWKDDVVPLLCEDTPFPLVIGVLNFSFFTRFDLDLMNEMRRIFPVAHIKNYMKSISILADPFSHWFCMFEIQLLFLIVELYKSEISVIGDLDYQVSLMLGPCMSTPYEWFMQRLFSEIIFKPSFICTKMEKFEESIDFLQNFNPEKLEDICNFYVATFLSSSELRKSWCLFHSHHSAVSTLSFELLKKPLPGTFWSFVPIMNYYKKSKASGSTDNAFSEFKSGIVNCLEWIYINSVQQRYSAIDHVPVAVQFAYFCLVFLIDDVFLDRPIQNLLHLCLKNILRKKINPDLINIKGQFVPTFEEIYAELLVQFEAASYGDEVFSNFIAVPLQQCYPSSWKLLLLSDHEDIVYFLNISLHKLAVPVENYLQPHETNESVLQRYYKSLSSGKLNHKRCPLLFLMAVHHLHHYVNNIGEQKTQFQQILMNSLAQAKEKAFSKYIFCYAGLNMNSDLGFSLKYIE